MADEKRRLRLPVFRPNDDDGEEARPPWQWVGFGTAAIFGAWLPLAYVAELVKGRMFRARIGEATSAEDAAAMLRALPPRELLTLHVATLVLLAVPLAAGAYLGGLLVGRWGKGAGVREAALAALAAVGIVSVLTIAQSGLSFAPLAAFALAVPFAAWGGRIGMRRRARLHGPDA